MRPYTYVANAAGPLVRWPMPDPRSGLSADCPAGLASARSPSSLLALALALRSRSRSTRALLALALRPCSRSARALALR